MVILKDWYERNRKRLYFALVSTFLWGLVAHSYAFFDNNLTWDSLNELHAGIWGNNLRMFSGRYFVPLYRDLFRSDVTLPWLIGFLFLFWMGLAVFGVLRIFKVESKIIAFLIAGIFVTNTTISATAATYIHDLDSFGVSLLCAVGAVYLWHEWSSGWLLGIPLITLSIGMYQSYVFTAATLVIIASILALINGKDFRHVFLKGLQAVAMVLAGGILYYIGLKTIVPLSGVTLSSGNYNSMDLILYIDPEEFPALIVNAYQDFFQRLWKMNSTYPTILIQLIQLVILSICIGALLVYLCKRTSGWKEKLLCLVLIILLPLVMNFLKVLTVGMNHDLMVFAIWMVYLLALLLADWLAKQWKKGELLLLLGKWQKSICLLLVAFLMYGNVQFANGMYLKKDLEFDAYLSLMTRIVYRMEECEEYIPGQTPVVFIGIPEILNPVIPGFKDYWTVTGQEFSDVIYAPERPRFQAYFDFILGMPILLAEDESWQAIQNTELAEQMSCYPSKDCIKMQNGTLIVKLGRPWKSK